MIKPFIIICAAALTAAGTLTAEADDLRITELMQSNVTGYFDDTKNFTDSWVELYNAGTTTVDLSAYSIGVKSSASKAWQLPSTRVAPGDYVVVCCDKEETGLHTSFRLESDKAGSVYLFNNGTLVASVSHPAQPAPDIAYGIDSNGNWGYELNATPGAPNDDSHSDASLILGDPVFSHTGCVNPDFSSVSLSLPADAPAGTVIRYTLDGSMPTSTSKSIDNGASIAIDGNTIVRARLFCDGRLSPMPVSHSYITHHTTMTMPIIALTGDNAYFYNRSTGILAGYNYENDWRRPVNIELFDDEQAPAKINQVGETRVGGGWSRCLPLKSMMVYANKRFGNKRLLYEFFPDQRPGLTDYKSIMLRNAGNDYYETYMRDAVVQRSFCSYAGFDWQAHRAAAIYLNGKYLGILNIRDRSNDDNIYTTYAGLENIDMVENWEELKAGTIDSFNDLMTFAKTSGHTAADFEAVIDVKEYTDVHLMNLFFNNTDFPGNNMVLWRPTAADGRWRIIVKDTDYAMGIGNASSDSKAKASFNTVEWLYTPGYPNANNWGNKSDRTLLFRSMMENEEIRESFFDRAFVYLGDMLNDRNVTRVIDQIKEELQTEWPYHDNLISYHPYGTWERCVSDMRAWVEERAPLFTPMLAKYYKLSTLRDLTVSRDESAAALPVVFNGITTASEQFMGAYEQNRAIRLSTTAPEGKEARWTVTTQGAAAPTVVCGDELTMAMPQSATDIVLALADKESAIDAVGADSSAPAVYYNLQGIRIDRPAKGEIVIRRQGNRTTKVVVR